MKKRSPRKTRSRVADSTILYGRVWSYEMNSMCLGEMVIYYDDVLFCHLDLHDFCMFVAIMDKAKIKITERI